MKTLTATLALSAVWMHVPPAEQEQAFATLVDLTAPRGTSARPRTPKLPRLPISRV